MADGIYDDQNSGALTPPPDEERKSGALYRQPKDADLDDDTQVDEEKKSSDLDEESLLDAEHTEEDADDDEDEDEEGEEEDLYNATPYDPAKGRIRNSLRDVNVKNIKKKDLWEGATGGRKLFAWVGLSGLLMSMLVGFLMFMTVYRSEHIRNLLWDYRFAKFHYQVAKRIKANIVSMETLSPGSNSTLKFERTSLGQKLRGYSPDKALNSLSEKGMKVQVERGGIGGLGESKITGFTDVDGKVVVSEHAKVIPEGARVVPATEFADLLNTRATSVLESAGHTKYFQKQTRRMLSDKVKIKFGDRFKAFKEKIAEKLRAKNGDELTEKEKQAARTEADAKVAQGDVPVGETAGITQEAVDEIPKDMENGIVDTTPKDLLPPVPGEAPKPVSRVRAKLTKGASVYSEVSTGVFLVTMGCILKDVSSSINDTLTKRIESPMRLAGNLFGEAEQLRSNDNVSLDAVKTRNKDFDNVEQSAAMQRISGTPEAEISPSAKLSAADLPFTFFGISLGTIATISGITNSVLNAAAAQALIPIPGAALLGFVPGFSDVTDKVVKEMCSYVLNPIVQAGIAAIDLVALIVSIGGTAAAEGAVRATIEGIKAGVQIAASVGLMKIVFEYFLPKMLFAMAGSGGILGPGDPNNGNKMDLGAALLSSQYGGMAGGTRVSDAQAREDQAEAMALVKKHEVDKDGAWAYINPENPYSLTSQFALSLPGDPMKIPGALITKSFSFLFSKTPLSSLGNIISPKAKAAGENGVEFETYGIPQTGITSQLIDEDPVANALKVDGEPGQLDALKTKYEHCFTSSLAESALTGTFSSSNKDFSICSDEMAQRLGLYNIDNCSTTLLSESSTANNCSIFAGAGDVVAGEGESNVTVGSGGTSGGASDGRLPKYDDTSPCPSDPDIQPAGTGSAQRDGKTVNFTLCKVMNKATVNVVYARNFLNLFKGAQAAGLDLNGGGGSYLPYDGAVARWQDRCGSRPISSGYAAPPCVGARIAPPGKSNHELGLAVDLTCPGNNSLGGHTTSRATFDRSDPCVAWVIQNSPSMGLYLQCEGTSGSYCESWHISPTGG